MKHVHCGVILGINTKPTVESKESHKNPQTELAFGPTHETFIMRIRSSSVTIPLTIMSDHIIIFV